MVDSREKVRIVLISIVLALGTCLLYLPSSMFQFINFDDPRYVVTNWHIRQLNWESFKWCFNAGYECNWHPLTWMSHMLDIQIWGLRSGGHHLTNFVLHTITTVLLFLLLWRLTGATWRSALVAALFGWHPTHVESVAWISERKDVLSGLFFVLTLLAYVRYVEKSGVGNYMLVLVVYTLGLMAKPMLVTLPFVLLLLDWWPLGRFASAESGRKPCTIQIALIEKLPLLLLVGGSAALTLVAQTRGGAVSSLDQVPVAARALAALGGYFRYVKKLFWPVDLANMYPFEQAWQWTEIIAALLLIGGLLSFGARNWKERPYWLCGWLWFFGMLVPVVGIVQVGSQSIADRYTYLPSIGMFIAVVWGGCELLTQWRVPRAVFVLIGAGVPLAAAFVASQQLQYWRTGEALFKRTLAVTKNNPVARSSLGAYYLSEKRLEDARKELEVAVDSDPQYAAGQYLLGEVLNQQKKEDIAAPHFEAAIRPNFHEPRLRLAEFHFKKNHLSDTVAQASIVLDEDANDPEAHYWLGRVLAIQGHLDKAMVHFRETLRFWPESSDAHYQLGLALSIQGHTAEAVKHYREALRLQPNYADALNNLAWILAANADANLRNGTEAVTLAIKACNITTNSEPLMIGTLAAAYAEAQRFDEAVAFAQKARDAALAKGEKEIAARNEQLMELYRTKQAFHEAAVVK